MRRRFLGLVTCGLLLIGIPFMAQAGGVFVTGHDPDYHAHRGSNATGARHIIQRAVEYVTLNNPSPNILLVTDLRNPGGDQSDPRFGMNDAGYTYDVADYGSGTSGVFDLSTVNFSNYDAIVVASDYGGWLRQDELDVLNARSADLISYINGGGGLVALNESGNRPAGSGAYTGTTNNRYGFLPFLVSEVPEHQGEQGVTVTAAGLAMGLTNNDVNGNVSHSYFDETGGMDVIDIDSQGRYLTLATRQPIGPGGVAGRLDVKPQSCPNPFNVKWLDQLDNGQGGGAKAKKGGVLPVAIVGSEHFDVMDIDVATILLEGVAPLRWNYEDVTSPVESTDECACNREQGDGWMDLTLKFSRQEIAGTFGSVMDGDVLILTLTAELLDGTPFEASDCVIIRAKDPEPPTAYPGGEQVVLGLAVPNPFNPGTTIGFTLPKETSVRLIVYDVKGRLVERLVDGVYSAGEHSVYWDATGLPSGTYFYRLETPTMSQARRMILLK